MDLGGLWGSGRQSMDYGAGGEAPLAYPTYQTGAAAAAPGWGGAVPPKPLPGQPPLARAGSSGLGLASARGSDLSQQMAGLSMAQQQQQQQQQQQHTQAQAQARARGASTASTGSARGSDLAQAARPHALSHRGSDLGARPPAPATVPVPQPQRQAPPPPQSAEAPRQRTNSFDFA
jgi:hypothetical protein